MRKYNYITRFEVKKIRQAENLDDLKKAVMFVLDTHLTDIHEEIDATQERIDKMEKKK